MMKDQLKWWDNLKKIPVWISGTISLATAVIGFVLLLQGNYHLGITILGILVILFCLIGCFYLAFVKTPPLIEGGAGVYRYEKYRSWAFVGIGLAIMSIAAVFMCRPSREFITLAFGITTQITPSNADSEGCASARYSELPPDSTATIETIEPASVKTQVPYNTLRYEHMSSLRLASGILIDFKRMRSFELTNPDFLDHFTADVSITFLDCTTHEDVIHSRSSSNLTAETEYGPFSLHILDVKRVDFQE
jgi:hypothetical protein